jgi:hypothetical protein
MECSSEWRFGGGQLAYTSSVADRERLGTVISSSMLRVVWAVVGQPDQRVGGEVTATRGRPDPMRILRRTRRLGEWGEERKGEWGATA